MSVIPCLGVRIDTPDGYDFDCEYPHSGGFGCEDCIVNGGRYDPRTGMANEAHAKFDSERTAREAPRRPHDADRARSYIDTARVRLFHADCREALRQMEPESVQTCITSPPYFGLRDYGAAGQLGLEPTPEEYVANMVEVFREVRRVLRDDGTLWLNLGDSYAGCAGGTQGKSGQRANRRFTANVPAKRGLGLKPKDLIGIPWRVAFALQADGWYLRQDIIWHKPNPMPESVRDRCTKAHEYLFLLSKSPTYFYDADAVKERGAGRELFGNKRSKGNCKDRNDNDRRDMTQTEFRNRRSVWTVTTKPFKGAHFATFPPDLIEPCVLAGSRAGDLILDPFNGAGTTGLVALKHGRRYVGCDVNADYLAMTVERLGLANSQADFFAKDREVKNEANA